MRRKSWLVKAVWYIIQLLEELVKANNADVLGTLKDDRPSDPPVNG